MYAYPLRRRGKYCFKQALHDHVAAAQYHDADGVDGVGHMDVGTKLNSWAILHNLSMNPASNVIEEGRGEEQFLVGDRSESQWALNHPTGPDA